MTDDPNAMMGGPRDRPVPRGNAFQAPAGRADPQAPNALGGAKAGAALRGQIAGLTAQQRAAAARQAEILAAVGQGLAQRPYAERRALLAHMAPHLTSSGLAPELVARFDPTDANLAGAIGQALAVRSMVETDRANRS
jgi:hypothetical protein